MTHTLETLLEMPLDELRVMVAQYEGWKVENLQDRIDAGKYKDSEFVNGSNFDCLVSPTDKKMACLDKPRTLKSWINYLPDYCKSLDAIKSLEDGLTDEEKHRYINHLCNIVDPDGDCGWQSDFAIATATAHHRAVAFCATKMKL